MSIDISFDEMKRVRVSEGTCCAMCHDTCGAEAVLIPSECDQHLCLDCCMKLANAIVRVVIRPPFGIGVTPKEGELFFPSGVGRDPDATPLPVVGSNT